jgi:hypothetical protein
MNTKKWLHCLFRKKVICRDCEHCNVAYLTGYDGQGINEAGICFLDITMPKFVDPGAIRKCEMFSRKPA